MPEAVHLPGVCENGHIFPSGIQRPPEGGFAIGHNPTGLLAGGTLSYSSGVLSTEGVSLGSCPIRDCRAPAHVPDGVWDFTERFVVALARLEPERASAIAQRIAAAQTDEEVEAATAEAPEVQELVREARAKPDTKLWRKVFAAAALAFLPAVPGSVIDYQAKEQAHDDARRQIELAERQLEMAEEARSQARVSPDQETIHQLVARILCDVAGEEESDRSDLPARTARRMRQATPGRNQPCWCDSGKKYKFCHLKEDKVSGDPPPYSPSS